jgi:hypothetical protein
VSGTGAHYNHGVHAGAHLSGDRTARRGRHVECLMFMNTIAPKDLQVSRARCIAVRLEAARAWGPCLCCCSGTSFALERASHHIAAAILLKPRCTSHLQVDAREAQHAGLEFVRGRPLSRRRGQSRPGTSCAERVGKSHQQRNDGRGEHGLLLRRRRRDKAQPHHT